MGGAADSDSDAVVTAVVAILTFGVLGTVLLGGGLWLAYSALPREAIVDWGAGTVTVRDRLRRTVIPFPTIVDLRMRSETEVRSDRSRNSSRYWRCILSLQHRPLADGETRRTDLAETQACENPADPRRQMLPLVTDLAEAMKVDKLIA